MQKKPLPLGFSQVFLCSGFVLNQCVFWVNDYENISEVLSGNVIITTANNYLILICIFELDIDKKSSNKARIR